MALRPPRPRVRALHPIQVVVRRTGLSADVIRAWEKRHAVVTPTRAANGRRLYSDADVERLRLLAAATLTGRSIGQLAGLSRAGLEAAARETGHHAPAARRPAPDGDGAAVPAAPHLRAALEAAERFDGSALDATLRRALFALPADRFLDSVAVPFWERMTARSSDGLPAPHRHLALATLRRMLHRLVEPGISPPAGPELVVATPSGQPQELGALISAAAAVVEGWRVTYVGPGLPAEEIAQTVTEARARAVAVSLGSMAGDRAMARELRRLRDLLPRGVPILVEGAAAAAHSGAIREISGTVFGDLSGLRTRLRALSEG